MKNKLCLPALRSASIVLALSLVLLGANTASAQRIQHKPLTVSGAGAANVVTKSKNPGSQAVLNAIGFSYRPIAIPGAETTSAFNISNTGFVAGSFSSAGITRGYFSNGFGFVPVVFFGSTLTVCTSVNTSNVAVGYTQTPAGVLTAFSFQNGVFTQLMPSTVDGPGILSVAFAINDQGDVGGYFLDALGVQHGFLFKNNLYTIVDVPGHTSALVFGLNNGGTATVQAVSPLARTNSFFLTNGSYTLRNVPGAAHSYIHGLNTAGTTTYAYQNVTDGPFLSALFVNGRFIGVGYPGAFSTFADGINNANVIAGNTSFPDLTSTGFVATPTQ